MLEKDNCNCGNDHEHNNEDKKCGCGHGHDHGEHGHNHGEHGCGCGQKHGEHGHNHGEHECGCGHNHEDGKETVTLTFENGETTECLILGIFEVEENEYIALLPMGDETLLIYKYAENDDEGPELSQIESDEEYEKVIKVFNEIFDDIDEPDEDLE